MKNIFLISWIWSKLENKKTKNYSITGILLFYLLFNFYYYFQENGEMSLNTLILNIIIAMGLGAFVSGVVIFGWQNLSLKKNTFLTQIEILNKDNFIRVYIMYYMIMIPISFLL